jgi:hypothetical protein
MMHIQHEAGWGLKSVLMSSEQTCAFQGMTSSHVSFARHFAHFPYAKCGKLRGVCGGSIVQYTYLELDLVGGQIGIL